MSDAVLYDDGLTRLDSSGIRLDRYYFPLGRPRRLGWSELRGFRVVEMNWRNGRYRGWGSHRPDWWFPFDVSRRRKTRMIVLDVRGVKPVCTPDDVDAVVSLLEQRLGDRAR